MKNIGIEKEKALFELLMFVKKNNPFLKKRMEDIEILDGQSVEVLLKRIPTITKHEVIKAGKRYFSTGDEEVFWEFTSGTTGVPFKCYILYTKHIILSQLTAKT